MHSGTSVAQPCFTCGAGRETRTPTPKRWYLKPMRLPIPPYPHVGRRYVTMFWKGQARLIAASRFARTFLGSPPQPQKPAGTFLPFRARMKGNGAPADDDTRGRKTAHAVSLFPVRLHMFRQEKRATFMRLHDIIYRTCRPSFYENARFQPNPLYERPLHPHPCLCPARPLVFSRTARLGSDRCRQVH